jgi:putative transposase
LFLAVVIDLFSRRVVGWSLRDEMTRDIVIDALRMAWFKRHPGKHAGLIFHSDRGSQYASYDFRTLLSEYGITSSMSRKGNCWDNACSETLFGSLKVERLHGHRFKTRREAKDETIEWLLWYNRARLHSRWPTSARCSSSSTGLLISQGKPTHELGYGVWIPGARSVERP